MIGMIQKVPTDPIYHTIKWLDNMWKNRARLWKEYLDILWKGKPHPELKGRVWGWLAEVLNPKNYKKKEELDQQLFKLSALEGMADSEIETISNLAFQLKYQSTEIKATRNLMLDRSYAVLNNISTEITVSEEALCYQKKVKRMRKRDLITYKLKNNLELTIPEKKDVGLSALSCS